MKFWAVSLSPGLIGYVLMFGIAMIPGAMTTAIDPITEIETTELVGIYETIINIISIVMNIIGVWI